MYEEKAPVKHIILSMMKKDTLVYDLIYNPPKTHLLKTCETYGMKILNGKKMLVFQAEKAFEIWTGKKFSDELLEQWA
jgi:shikimate dehydrogenase